MIACNEPRGGGKGEGKIGGEGDVGVRNIVLQFIDGAYFDPSLAGGQAPALSAFSGFHPSLRFRGGNFFVSS